MSKMEAGQLRPAPQHICAFPVDQQHPGNVPQPRRITLRLAISAGVLPDALYRSGRLCDILLNLLSNAVKFAAGGEVRISAVIRTSPPAANLTALDSRLIRISPQAPWIHIQGVRDPAGADGEAQRDAAFRRRLRNISRVLLINWESTNVLGRRTKLACLHLRHFQDVIHQGQTTQRRIAGTRRPRSVAFGRGGCRPAGSGR